MKRTISAIVATIALFGAGAPMASATPAGSTTPQNTSVPGWAWLLYDDRAFGLYDCERMIQVFKIDDPGSYRCVPAQQWPGQWYVEKWTHYTG